MPSERAKSTPWSSSRLWLMTSSTSGFGGKEQAEQVRHG